MDVESERITLTNKMHVLLFHVKEFIRHHNCSLGFYSEQAVESVHYDFDVHNKNYTNHTPKENINGGLLRSVCAYNANHL